MPTLLSVLVLAAFAYLAVATVLVWHARGRAEKDRLSRRLSELTGREPDAAPLDIVKKHQLSAVPWLDTALSRQRWTSAVDRMLAQADIRAPLGVFVLSSLVLAVFGAVFVQTATRNTILAGLASAALAALPFWWIRLKRKRRMAHFEKQLPEALDLVARALKAGHTFNSGMAMVGQEFGDPIRMEFGKTLEEINFGVTLMEALDNIMDRVDCPDLNFFVVSLKIQSETGGNLAEIVENISSLIRERFKLRGRIRILSAEGRFAALVLSLMPFGVAGAIYASNPSYIMLLVDDPLGRMILWTCGGMMLFGILVMRKMIRIAV
ncbi:type II secretion system F family protein [Desulfovibrio sulfodismutans]|uniref:Type II secretion system F family protein n=1 Tax=Desulfolutivibrio sulfodismutans TaxID=63561 RepID=A0A7K3NKL1_9BACT|nr:type II secretion system F family protein [Desulfolutivibrio sulfodismutans]NDY56720.1 type II secretion system F family protein [Desulfolutivibrio sulfodismutans]QLA13992.1 type II secretion protein F [Desulfolutivibrio sulfodismutans DSM 3696]